MGQIGFQHGVQRFLIFQPAFGLADALGQHSFRFLTSHFFGIGLALPVEVFQPVAQIGLKHAHIRFASLHGTQDKINIRLLHSGLRGFLAGFGEDFIHSQGS